MRLSAGHFVGTSEPAHCAVLVARNAVAIVTPDDLASVTLYSIEQLIPRTEYDISAMLTRWSDGMICLEAPEGKT
jgi:hypothetical protein